MGTFLIFFLIFLMGICWWIGLSYDIIYKSMRECSELRRELDSPRKRDLPEAAELTEAYISAAGRANHRMCNTLSGRLVARIFHFHTVRKLEE
ncbi:MAG: hypothetical protein STSR0007_09790 [Thermovirga sp.]